MGLIGTLNTPGSTSLHGRALNPITDNKTRIHTVCFSLTLWFLRGAQDPIPSRTRPSNSSAPMVLSLKAWESRSLQGLPKTYGSQHNVENNQNPQSEMTGGFGVWGGWGSVGTSPQYSPCSKSCQSSRPWQPKPRSQSNLKNTTGIRSIGNWPAL